MQPKQIASNLWFMGTPFQNSQCESILRNIVVMQKSRNPEEFTPFSWEEYQDFCSHKVTTDERDVLNSFVDGRYINYRITNHAGGGWLKFEDGKYSFTPKLIGYLITDFPAKEDANFVKTFYP